MEYYITVCVVLILALCAGHAVSQHPDRGPARSLHTESVQRFLDLILDRSDEFGPRALHVVVLPAAGGPGVEPRQRDAPPRARPRPPPYAPHRSQYQYDPDSYHSYDIQDDQSYSREGAYFERRDSLDQRQIAPRPRAQPRRRPTVTDDDRYLFPRDEDRRRPTNPSIRVLYENDRPLPSRSSPRPPIIRVTDDPYLDHEYQEHVEDARRSHVYGQVYNEKDIDQSYHSDYYTKSIENYDFDARKDRPRPLESHADFERHQYSGIAQKRVHVDEDEFQQNRPQPRPVAQTSPFKLNINESPVTGRPHEDSYTDRPRSTLQPPIATSPYPLTVRKPDIQEEDVDLVVPRPRQRVRPSGSLDRQEEQRVRPSRPLDRQGEGPRRRPIRPEGNGPRILRPGKRRGPSRSRPRVPKPDPSRAYTTPPDMQVPSQRLVELFRAQLPVAPELPPAVISPPLAAPLGGSARDYLPPPLPPGGESPPVPRFKRSMRLRGVLTVPSSDYSENYTVWWDSKTGEARVDYHEFGTSTIRQVTPDGQVRRIEVQYDRTGEEDVVRCLVLVTPATDEDRHPVGLPDTSQFVFAGYVGEGKSAREEVWRREVAGEAGQLGAAAAERLSFSHELRLRRDPSTGDPTPLRYSVQVDSSILGPNCDGYEHRYVESNEEQPPPSYFQVDLGQVCDVQVEGEAGRGEDRARADPLREYTLPHRDDRYDQMFSRFKEEFQRTYADETEEAVRKAVYVQYCRVFESTNRQGASFTTKVNYLSDRLQVEVDQLRGATVPAEGDTRPELPADRLLRIARTLPDTWNWQRHGGVTHVRNQGSCPSCWAHSVVAAVEGARYIRTGVLEPLSEQSLVDCAHTHRARGCNNTWPRHAFNYVIDRGLPALDEYPPYKEMVGKCSAPPVPSVAFISSSARLPPNNVDVVKAAIKEISPVVVTIDSMPINAIGYYDGVYMNERCVKGPKKKLNHAVTAVGWGRYRGDTYLLVKNSWSAAWGDGGYMRLHAPSNTCGVLTVPEVPLIEDDLLQANTPHQQPRQRPATRNRPTPQRANV